MAPRNKKKLAGALLAAGGLLVALGAIPPQHLGGKALSGWLTAFTVAGLASLLLALAVAIWAILSPRVRLVERSYDCDPAKHRELREIYEFSTGFFGNQVSSLNQLKSMYARNRKLFWVVRRASRWFWRSQSSTPRMIGYFSVIPLKSSAAIEIENGELDGTDFDGAHIARSLASTEALYIGGIAATVAKGQVVYCLKKHVQDSLRSGIRKVYARPISPDGVRLARDYGFVCIGTGGEIELGRVASLPQTAVLTLQGTRGSTKARRRSTKG